MSARQLTPEKEWQRTLIDTLEFFGWAVNHMRPAMNQQGDWRTAYSAPGWPDLVALRGQWLIAIEVKGETTRVQRNQREWLGRFAQLRGGRAWILRPQDSWDSIVHWIRHPEEAPKAYGFEVPDLAALDE